MRPYLRAPQLGQNVLVCGMSPPQYRQGTITTSLMISRSLMIVGVGLAGVVVTGLRFRVNFRMM